MSETPRPLAKKIREKVRFEPELKSQLSDSLDRLIKFLNLSEQQKLCLRLLAGFAESGFSPLSLTRDESLYDILDTYELERRLRLWRSWDLAWDSLRKEFELLDPVCGSVPTETVQRMQSAFQEIRNVAGEDIDPDELRFENFARDPNGKLIILL